MNSQSLFIFMLKQGKSPLRVMEMIEAFEGLIAVELKKAAGLYEFINFNPD